VEMTPTPAKPPGLSETGEHAEVEEGRSKPAAR
jgi:hypothetical protein